MAYLERSSAVIELGKRFIAQMDLDGDEVSQWMAHVLAERIHDAENAPAAEKVAAQNSCVDLIFQLWTRRFSLPAHARPFAKLEPLLQTLESLDANKRPRFRFIGRPRPEGALDERVAEMLSLATNVDDAARILIQYFLAAAAEEAADESKSWVQSALDAELDATLEVRILSFVDGGLDRASEEAKVVRDMLEEKISTLESFASLATSHAERLKEKLSQITDKVTDAEPTDK
ncbi:AVAST type 3 anti-phage proein Avs3b [Massilia sp. PWRC2]|uniref:AVAST type 3 anti-phage proein Avs3b n=1 Tax=Massilia sp. PWRC2 TaxID=2804626 RepID=UPI003CF872E1